MQDRGILPSVVENTIKTGDMVPSRGGTKLFTDSDNKVRVVTNHDGKVITVSYGK